MSYKIIILLTTLLPLQALGFNIYPQVPGVIIGVKAIGTQVNEGDVIIKLDDRQAKLKLEYQKILQGTKQQNFNDKELELKQTKELFDRMVASHRDLEIAQIAFDAAKRELDASKIKIKIEQIELEKYTITSPISGFIRKIPNPRNVTNVNTPKALMVIE